MASAITTTTATTGTVAAPITAADQERIDQALQDSRSANTQYRSAWRGWAEWCAGHGHATMPADPIHVAAYLAERTEQGAVAATVRTIRAAIGAAHRDQGADDPTAHDGVRHVLQGLGRQAAGRGRGQAQGLTVATAATPRRTGRGMESEAAATERGAVDAAIAAVLFRVGYGAAKRPHSDGVTYRTPRTARACWCGCAGRKPIREGTAADVRYPRTAPPRQSASCATTSPSAAPDCARTIRRRCSAG